MAVKCDSTGAYYRVSQLGQRFADISLATAIGINATGGAGGRACWDLSTGICAVGDAAFTGSLSTIIAGARFKLPSIPTTNPFTILALWETGGATTHVSLRVNTSGKLEVGRGLTGNVVATGNTTVQTNRWYYADCSLTINATTGVAEVVLWDDAGIKYVEISASALNTRNGGTSGVASRVYYGPQLVPGGFTASALMQDIYMSGSTNSYAAGLLGPVRVVPQQTSADGFYSASNIAGSSPAATRWQSVHEIPSDEDVTTVATTASTATKDTYKFGTITAEDTIWFVQPVLRVKVPSSSLILTPVTRSNGVDSSSAGIIVTGAAYTYYVVTAIDLDIGYTSVPWTRKSLSAADFGWSVGSSPTISITQHVVEVVFSDAPRGSGLVLADGWDDLAASGTAGAPAHEFDQDGSSSTSLTIAATGGANGKACLNSQQAALGVSYNVDPRYRIQLGFKFKYGQNPNQNWLPLCGVSQLGISSAEKPQLYIGIGTTGKIEVRRGVLATDTLLDNSQAAPSVNNWHQMFFDLTVDAAGGAVQIKVDGTQILNLTAINTTAGAGTSNGRIDRVSVGIGATTPGNPWSSAQSFGVSFDDFFAQDPASGFNVSDPGNCTVEAIMPAGAGALTQSTIGGSVPAATQWQGVNEIPPNDATTVNSFTAQGQEDLYTLAALSGVHVVFGIGVRLRMAAASGISNGFANLYPVARVGAGGADALRLERVLAVTSTSWVASAPRGWDADPTGNQWAYATLASLQVGARRNDNIGVNANLTQLAVQVLRSDASSLPGPAYSRGFFLS